MAYKKRDAEATRTAILDAAEQLFIEHGFGKTSLSQISRTAQVTKSLIHHHFGSKEALWREVKRRYYLDYTEAQEDRLQQQRPTLELLVVSMIKYFRYLQSKPDFARMRGMMLLENDHGCDEIFMPIVDQGIVAIQAAQAAGELRKDISADHILISILFMIENWFLSKGYVRRTHYRHIPDEDFDANAADEAFLRSLISIYLRGVVPPDYETGFSTEEIIQP